MSQTTHKPPFPRDDDFYRRKRDRASGDGRPTISRFFQTVKGPDKTPYPRGGNVFYANLLRDVTFSPVTTDPKQTPAMTGTLTNHFEYLWNLGNTPPIEGAIVKAVKIGARWWIDSAVGSPTGLPAGVLCDPFDCVYPGAGSGECTDLEPFSSGLPEYQVQFGQMTICNGKVGGLQILKYQSDCEWRSDPITCTPDKLFWKLTIDPGASHNGEQGAVFLQLFDFATGQPYDPEVKYCKYGGYPLWCGLCDNQLQLCCGVGQNAQSIGSLPGSVCVKPYRIAPNCGGNDGQGGGLDSEYLVSIDGFAGDNAVFNGDWIVQFCPVDLRGCSWTGFACAACGFCGSDADGNAVGVEQTGESATLVPPICTIGAWGIYFAPRSDFVNGCRCGGCGFMPGAGGQDGDGAAYRAFLGGSPVGTYFPANIVLGGPPYPATIQVSPLP